MVRYKNTEKDQGYFVTIYPSEHFDENSIEKVIDNFVEEHVDTALFDEKYKNDTVGQKAPFPAFQYYKSILNKKDAITYVKNNISNYWPYLLDICSGYEMY